ncbi:LytR/AlgR family response regulator transcription factor [Anaeromicropila populeti]|uniref:Stage 0 sporulation protein A homolog n=1 Tax=Anaeromicropila populeti TaxID=37658 RepID=A0A1I6JSL3_9FIRM|nr:LytTR family DNA-binding domain-containing protein [Anaeromicropila populeti]SFR81947.1 two component transcriptional regulator, LytTR family [Anaeromicropila populeti]
MLKIAVCDDNESICGEIEKILQKIEKECSSKLEIEVFYSGEELCNGISNKEQFDIIFLDIELKLMSGIEVGTRIREEMQNDITQIVYISSKETYAMDLFKIRPLDFLIKPIQYQRIYDVIMTAQRLINKGNQLFEYQFKHATYKVPVKNILYFESENRKINIITTDEVYSFYGTIDSVYKMVRQYNFLEIHKSYLVNYNYIIKFEYRQVTLSNKKVLPISQMNRKRIRAIQLQLEKDGVDNGPY